MKEGCSKSQEQSQHNDYKNIHLVIIFIRNSNNSLSLTLLPHSLTFTFYLVFDHYYV